MTNAKKAELIALLKGEKAKNDRKTYSLRLETKTFESVEDISLKSGRNINDILNALIELGLAEYSKA